MTDRTFSTTDLLDRDFARREPEFRFSGHSQADWSQWRTGLLEALRTVFGDIPGPGAPPAFEVIETFESERHIRRKIVYETRHDVPVPAWLCIPRDIDGPAPGVLCIHGHGPHGKDALVDAAAAGPGLPFAAALADEGCVTLAPDHAGFGERDSGGGCNLLHARLNLLGVDITGYRVHDLVRATDLLASLPEVDERRIADVGFSLGCWLAEVHTAFDARIGAAVLSGWFTTLAQTVWTGHCVCHRSLGLGAICEIPDIIGLAAPRPVAAEWGADDTSRPVRPAFDMARDIWRAAGAEQDAELFEFDGDHWFDGTESIPWLVGKLRAL